MAATNRVAAPRPGGAAPSLDLAWRARRIVRLLMPAAAALGGFASAEVRVDAGLGLRLRPDVCVALGEPPHDGVLRSPPLLVVVLAEARAAAAWLALGTEAVWVGTADGGRRYLADGEMRVVPPGGRLDVPGRPGLHLAVDDLHGGPRVESAVPLPSDRPVR